MRFASIFSGVGGFDLGLERAGHECVLQVELDDFRSSVLKRHWRGVPLVRDVRELRAGEPFRPGGADLLCGGFPCRDLSVCGRGRGIEAAESEDGSGLFFELARVADDLLRPGGWLLIENVPGMLSASGGRDFAVLLRTLGDLGFHDLAWRVLDSRLHGVPQSRRRVFVLARRADGSAARRVLLEREGGAGDRQAGGGPGSRAAGAGPGGAEGEGEELSAFTVRGGRRDGTRIEVMPDGLSPALRAASGGASTSIMIAESVLGKDYAHTLMAEGHDASEDGTGRGTPLVMVDVGQIESGQGDGLTFDATRTLHTRVDQQVIWHPRDEGVRVRRLTPTECERLQGFPDGWTVPTGPTLRAMPSWYSLPPEHRYRAPVNPPPHGPRYEAMGRAVTVPVIEAIGRRLREWELSAA